jgi:hypothetical protein
MDTHAAMERGAMMMTIVKIVTQKHHENPADARDEKISR